MLNWENVRVLLADQGLAEQEVVKHFREHPYFTEWNEALRLSGDVMCLFEPGTQRILSISAGSEPLLEHPPSYFLAQGLKGLVDMIDPSWMQGYLSVAEQNLKAFNALTPAQRLTATLSTATKMVMESGRSLIMLARYSPIVSDPETGQMRITLLTLLDVSVFYTLQYTTGRMTYATGELARNKIPVYKTIRSTPTSAQKLTTLTKRELQVLSIAAEGLTSKEIASRLGISSLTVNTHRLKLLAKTGSRNITELVRMAVGEGII
jgi:DNA-binding CsgD family transcriptional regulator